MIFTTKNKELSISGQSLSEIKKKLIDFNEIWMQGGRYSSNKPQLIPEEDLIKELSFDEAKNKLDNFTNIVIKGNKTLDKYFSMFPENNDVLRTYVTTTDRQSQSIQGLVKASKNARAAQLAHNEAIKTQTLSAKAGKVALQALATAGNMLAMWAVSKGIELLVTGIDHIVHSAEYAQKSINAATDSAKSFSNAIKNIQKDSVDMGKKADSIIDRYAELAQGVNPFTNENESLSTAKYEEFLELNRELTELFPSLTRNYDENGNAILGLSGSVDSVTESIRSLVKQENELAHAKIRENLEGYFNGADDTEGAWKALEGKKQTLEDAGKKLEYLTTTYDSLINSDEKVIVGRFHKNSIYREEAKYLEYVKNNFGEEIADAIEDVSSIYIGRGLNGQFADFEIDFNKLKLSDSQKEQITMSYDTFYSELLAKQKTAQSEFESQNSDFSNNAVIWLEDLSFYKNNSKYIQNAMQALISNIDWSNYDFNELDYDGVKRILQDSILTPFQIACEDPETKQSLNEALTGLFTMDTSDMSIDEAKRTVGAYLNVVADALNIKNLESLNTKITGALGASIGLDDAEILIAKIADTFKTDPVELKILFGLEGLEDIKKRVDTSIKQLTDDHGITDHDAYAYLTEHIDFHNLTQKQAEFWLDAANGAENAKQAVERYNAALAEANVDTLSKKLTASASSLDTFQSSVKSAYDAYAALLSGSYTASELLDSIQAITKAAADMGETINWESLSGQEHSLQALQEEIHRISQSYAESVLIDMGLKPDSDLGKLLTDIIQETHAAEMAFTGMNTQLDRLQSSYQTLTDFLTAYHETGTVSLEQLQSLLTADENLIAMLEVENGQLLLCHNTASR